MAKRIHFDEIIVIDLEATCHQDGNFPFGEEQEIIEIGICLLGIKTLQVTQKAQYLIRPEKSTVSEYCSDLTGLTQAKLDSEGVSFESALKAVEKRFNTKKRVWASYGEWDRKMFQKQCERQGLTYPFNYRHINIKTYVPIILAQSKEVGMTTALKSTGLELEGVHHCGMDDAVNAARILAELIRGGAAHSV